MSNDRKKSWPPFPVAIVGMSCRLPGAKDLKDFWTLLRSGTDAVREIPRDRWDVDYYFHPDPSQPGRTYARAGGFLDDIDGFDANFFGISPREARQMDPQQRILLELTWEALENADIVPAQLAGSDTGVFVGASSTDYGILQRTFSETVTDPYAVSGSAASITANRLSHFFDLHGPSLAIDTACSSALVAVHEACESLWRGEATLAVAGGINILLLPESMVGFSKAGMLSPTGRCHTFDADADGYVRSEGGGVVILKPLAAALAEQNPIHAVIMGSAVNSDGRTKGLALPNPVAQEKLLRRVYGTAGVNPADITYVEAHGTGTSAGDRVECTALGRVFGAARPRGEPCLISSVKSNIGHLEPASGIAGLLKAILALKHRQLPPTVHFRRPNPKIPFEDLNLAVVDKLTPLPKDGDPVMIGVNSFGFGGTNAHVILSSYDVASAPSEPAPARGIEPLFLSARSTVALKAVAERYAKLMRSRGGPSLEMICRSVALRRSHHAHRIATFGASKEEVAARLEAFAADQPALMLVESEARYQASRLAFVFSGNGSQWLGMGRDLLAQEPDFAACVQKVDALLKPLVGWSLLELLQQEEPADLLDKTEIAQPALFAVQIGIVELLRARGISADAMVGHSVGEVAAAYAAGILSLEDACLVIARRSQAQGRTAGNGKMAAVGLSEAQAAEAIASYGDALTIAGVNSPASVTLAGDVRALEALGKTLKGRGVFFRLLALDYAFHSRVMDPIQDEILRELAALNPKAGDRRFISTVTGADCAGTLLDAGYWWDNIRKPVQFARAIQRLSGDGIEVFLEIGPHPILAGYLRECLQGRSNGNTTIATLRRGEPEREALWMAIARCYTAGVNIDHAALFPGRGLAATLPLYPWHRERYWFAKGERVSLPSLGPRVHPLLGYRMPTADLVWKSQLDPVKLSYLADHVIQGATIFPATGYVETAIAAATVHFGTDAVEIEGLQINRPLAFSGKGGQWVEFDLSAEDNTFRIVNQEKAAAAQPPIVAGRMGALADTPPRRAAVEEIRSRLPRRVSGRAHYERCASHGLFYGPSFQGLAELWAGGDEVLARIAVPTALAGGLSDYRIHPALLDACLQSVMGALPPADADDDRSTYVPTYLERLRFFGGGGSVAWCHTTLLRADRHAIVARFALFDAGGMPLAEIDSMRFRRIGLARTNETPIWHWQTQLQPSLWAVGGSADLPSPKTVAAALTANMRALRRARRSDDVERSVARALDRLAAAYIRQALEHGGVGSEPFEISALVKRLGLMPEHGHSLGSFLAVAERHGYAKHAGECWTLVTARPDETPEMLWRGLIAEHPNCLASLEAIARCGEYLAALLGGGKDTGPVLFPERDFNAGEHLLDSDPTLRIGNDVAEQVVRHIRQSTPPDRALRILEIGGGTGSLAGAVLPALPADRTDYLFTDGNETAIARAQGRFTDFPFVRYATFDIGRDPASQGLETSRYDLILASHALDAASPQAGALTRVRSVLKPGGLLIMVEASPGGFLDVVFGAWQRRGSFNDNERSRLSPLLPAARWESLLGEAGFIETAVLGGAAEIASTSVIVARNVLGNGHAPAEPAVQTRRWVILADGPADGRHGMTHRLIEAGQSVLTVFEGAGFERVDQNMLRTPLADAEDYSRLVANLRDVAPAGVDILYLRALDTPLKATRSNGSEPDPMAAQDRGSVGLMLLVQALVDAGLAAGTQLWVVTKGAMSTPQQAGEIDPTQAPLWGTVRTLMNERPDMAFRLIDLDPMGSGDAAMKPLVQELLHPGDEDEVVLRGTARYVHRLRRGMPAAAAAASSQEIAYKLAHGAGETQGGLVLEPIALPEPASGEVVVRVKAAGLNYRDVLQRVGLLPEEAFEGGFAGATLGMEFAGEVVAVAPDVTSLKIGDGVFGFAPSAFSSHLRAAASSLFPKLPAMSFEEAATMPVAALTVYYSLHHMARLQRGERVLIHGAAGGVGLAAIQYAQWIGAEIFATAGTPAKREFLHRLGVRHVLDSRSLAFADEIRRLTNGDGVDVVLNSLAGEALHKGVSLLRPYGRFIELGKRDFWANTKLGLQPFRNNIQFCGVDVDRLLIDRPALAEQLFREIQKLIVEGVLRPLPHRVFPVMRAAEAFRHMQQSRHIGKVVLGFEGEVDVPVKAPSGSLSLVPDATYLVTGGRGGFGLATAEWLAAKGARHLVLIGRSPETKLEAIEALQRLQGAGVMVREAALDVADGGELARLIETIKREMPPLRGVIHCAAVIEDAGLANMTTERFRAVLRPKMLGAWNLDRLTRTMPLDFFVMYSSAITLFGNPGQSNYAAANLYLEALADRRRAAGLPALAVLWGAIEGVGHLARHAEVAKTMTERLGVKLLTPERAFEQLERAIVAGIGHMAVADLNWSRLTLIPQLAKSPKYALVRRGAGEPTAERDHDAAQLSELLAAMPETQRYGYVQQLVLNHLAAVLRMPAGKLDVGQSLLDLGMDSLMVVELQLAMEQQFGITISPLELMDIATVAQLVLRIAEKLDVKPAGTSAEAALPGEPGDIDTLPAEMLDDMLGKLLEREGDGVTMERVT